MSSLGDAWPLPFESWDVVALALLVLVAGGLQRSPADPLELRGPHSQPSLCATQPALGCGTAGLGHTPACLGPGSRARRWARGRTPASPSARSRPAFSAGLPRSNHSLLSLFEVGRPGAHHLVRVLHSDHEVSVLSLLLPGCLTPGVTASLWPAPVLWGTPHWGGWNGREMFRHCFGVLSIPGQGSQGWWVEDKATPK